MKKLVLIVSSLMIMMRPALAQDIHFTQYFTSPLTLNPAMTGLIPEDLRFAANYRSQWGSVSSNPYRTASFSFDMAILRGKLPEGDAIGIGLVAFNDAAGSGGYTNTTAGISLAYHKAFGRNLVNHISMGIQAVYVQKAIDFSKLTFEDMFDLQTAQLQPGAPQPTGNSSLSYPDFNAGAMYSGKVNDQTTAYIGYSYYHLTQPVESFNVDGNNGTPIHNRQSVYLGGSFEMNPGAVLYASALYQSQASATEILLGTAIGFVLNPGHDADYQKNTIFYAGGWYRYGDAISPYIGIEWSKMRLGLSYDVNVSRFTPATTYQGGYEISLLFFGKINKHERNPVYSWSCPKLY